MKIEDTLRNQLTARLKRLRERSSVISAEIIYVEQMLANAEQGNFRSSFRLRRNGVRKLNLQAEVRKHLGSAPGSVKAHHLFDLLCQSDPALKPATFRSHLKRMVAAGIIKQEGERGYYQLVERFVEQSRDKEVFPPQRKIKYSNNIFR